MSTALITHYRLIHHIKLVYKRLYTQCIINKHRSPQLLILYLYKISSLSYLHRYFMISIYQLISLLTLFSSFPCCVIDHLLLFELTNFIQLPKKLVEIRGFEPLTLGLQSRCSSQLSYIPWLKIYK